MKTRTRIFIEGNEENEVPPIMARLFISFVPSVIRIGQVVGSDKRAMQPVAFLRFSNVKLPPWFSAI
jgi:hypothetical protein